MIAILIADSEDFIQEITQKLERESYKVIRYTWLLKALDNLEEIAPNRIYVNALDYPRHWKTLVQYTNGNFIEKKPEIYLYGIDNFDEEEKEKAQCLHVKLIEDIAHINEKNESLMMVNPHTNKLILGSIKLLKNKSLIFNCENKESMSCLREKDLIGKVVLKKSSSISEPILKILSIHQNTLHLEII